MKTVSALVWASVFCFSAQAGTRIDDPVKFVLGVYQNMATNNAQKIPEDIYTPRLEALIALDRTEAHGEIPRGDDFSFWCNCQDGELKHPVVTGWDVDNGPGRKVVAAMFEIDGRKEEIHFYFGNSTDGWKLDDVQDFGKDGWTLSLILKYGWPLGK